MLLENTRIDGRFKNSHDLSILIKYAGSKLLFDTESNKNQVENLADLTHPISTKTEISPNVF